MGEARRDLVSPEGDALDLHVRRGGDVSRIERVELLDVGHDAGELAGEAVDLGFGEGQGRELRHVKDDLAIDLGRRHGSGAQRSMGSNPAGGRRIPGGGRAPPMQGKVVLITGANQGIGKASAIELGKLGARLVLVCRNGEKGRAAVADVRREGARDVELIVGDMSSQADVRRVAGEFKAKYDRLDVLLNNAGVLVTTRRSTIDGIEETFGVNHLGYFLLTHLLLEVLKASGPSRIVSVSSEAHRRGKMRWDDLEFKAGAYSAMAAYSQSKLANILFTREVARRLEGSGVTANCLHPGVIASGFGHTYGGIFSVVLKIASPFLITPEKGARTSVFLASSPEVQGVSGKYFDKCKQRQPSAEALVEGAPERLWAISESMTGVRVSSAAA